MKKTCTIDDLPTNVSVVRKIYRMGGYSDSPTQTQYWFKKQNEEFGIIANNCSDAIKEALGAMKKDKEKLYFDWFATKRPKTVE